MPVVQVTVKWGKNKYDVDIDTDAGVPVLKATLMSLTGVPADRQKVMAKGVWKGTLKDDADLNSFTFKKKQKVMLMGKASQKPAARKEEEVVFIEDMTSAEAAKVGAVIPAGLKNLGNTCYMNSTLQCLRKIPELREALDSFTTDGTSRDRDATLTASLARMYNALDASGEFYTPLMFVTALRSLFPMFAERGAGGGFKQQDADELNGVVMQALRGIKAAPKSLGTLGGEENVIDALFRVGFEERLHCTGTDLEKDVVKTTSAHKLRCNIDGGAGRETQINHLHQGVLLGFDGEVEKRSEVLGANAVWKKTQRISRLPKYLCIQFMRFYWKATPDNPDKAGVKCKMMRPVNFQVDNMDVYDFCSPALQKKLKVYRDKYADEILGAGDEKKADDKAAKASTAAAPAPAPAADTDGDVAMGAEGDDDDDDLARALAMSMEGAGGAGAGAGAGGDGDVTMDSDGEALLGPGIPAEFRGMYELFAVVSHKGRSADAGHYMGWVRQASGSDQWMCFDDDSVSPCKTEHIKDLKGGGDWDMTYIVFYRALK